MDAVLIEAEMAPKPKLQRTVQPKKKLLPPKQCRADVVGCRTSPPLGYIRERWRTTGCDSATYRCGAEGQSLRRSC